MKLLNIVILSTYALAAFAAFDGTGPHGDGRFLASDISGAKACPDGNFNLLEPDGSDSTIPALYDDTSKAIKNCKPCAKATFRAVYGAQSTGYAHAALNRNECCFNEDLAACQEMMRAYQEGCNSGGDTDANSRLYKDDESDNSAKCPT
tara:strand:+ start:100 stop:546 length:447 start_codon:yes stop_codon:yes gene_type:complete